MKRIKYTVTILLNIAYLLSYSQSEFVVEINKTNGAFTKTGPAIAGITYIFPDDRTFNESTETYIFQSADSNHRLYSIDVSNDSIINNPIVNSIQTLQFDNTSNILYELAQDNTNNLKKFISIDPVTGTYSQIGASLANSSMYSGVFSTFDKINHTFIFLNPPNILCSINATNGAIISNPTLVLASGENIVNFSFDNSTGILYGLLQDNNVSKYFLVTINTTTGTNVRIGSGTTFGAGGGSATIDETNQQYSYLYSNSTGFVVTTLDIATGSVVYNSLIQAFIASDNFFSLKYDNMHGKLYSIHWETNSTKIPETTNFDKVANIFPNPTSDQSTLQFDNTKREICTLTLYDLRGQIMRTINNITSDQVVIQKNDLTNGLYYFVLRTSDRVIVTGKLAVD